MKKYKFKKYSSRYPSLFEKEKNHLIRVLPDVFGLEHIGSTAVRGLGGEGAVDVLVSFKNKSDLNRAKEVLMKDKYELMTELRERISLRASRGFLFKHHFHIHLTLIGSDVWKQAIKFRDKLRGNSKIAEEYMKLKRSVAVVTKGESEVYRKLREAFILKHSK